jgi:Tol biopolymer transport system component
VRHRRPEAALAERFYTFGLSARTAAAALLLSGLLLAPGCGGGSRADWKIVFPGFLDGDWGLYAVGRAGGGPVRIGPSSEPSLGSVLSVSPDGRRLVFAAGLGVNGFRLAVMNADGSGRRDLGTGDPSSVAWSPDGKRIAFASLYGRLFVMDADGNGRRRLTGGDGDSNPAWSPDGNRLAFVREFDGVMLVDSDGRNLHLLSRAGDDVAQLHWAQDGRSLTLVTLAEKPDLVTLSVPRGKVLKSVHRVGAPYSGLSWSPDGQQVAFAQARGQVVVMNADGSGRRSLGTGSEPSWAPDGRTIAYLGPEQLGGSELRSIRPDGTGMRRLTRNYPDGVAPEMPTWLRGPVSPAPSPYHLAVSRRPDGAVLRMPYPVAVLRASGSRVALVSPERVWAPSWTTSPPLVIWDARRGSTQRLAIPVCHQPKSVALLAGRVGFDCPSGHGSSTWHAVEVLPLRHGPRFQLASGVIGDGVPPGRLPGRVAGRGRLLVFSTYLFPERGPVQDGRLWRLAGRRKVLVTRGADAGEPAEVDRGRIVVERLDGKVALVQPGGRVLGRVDPGGPGPNPGLLGIVEHPSVGLSGHNLVVLRAGRLQVYDAASFRLRRSWRVGRAARLIGVAAGLAGWAARSEIHLVRLRDWRVATIQTASGAPVDGSLTSAGLFYVLQPRRVPQVQTPPFRPDPATVVFVRRDALPLKP